jgi:3-oxoadipate enol-lactonase
VRQAFLEAAPPRTWLAELPGRGVTRVWDCTGPPGAQTLMLIHGVACTAELNWGKVFTALARHYRVVALDLRGHGDGIRAGRRFSLEDCADDVAALAGALGTGQFVAVGYSMGGAVAQLLYHRHAPLLSGLVLCSTAGNVRETAAEKLAALMLPGAAAAVRLNPVLRTVSAEVLGMALLGRIDDPATAAWARGQFRRTTLATALSAIRAVGEFTSDRWIGQVDIPAAVVVTARDTVVPVSRQLRLARAIPGATVHELAAGHGVCVTRPQLFVRGLLEACWSAAGGRRAGGSGRRRPAGHDVTAAKGQLTDLDVVHHLRQVTPRPAEPAEAPHVGRVHGGYQQVPEHHGRPGPLAATGGDRRSRAQLAHDVTQRVGGLEDVVHGAEQGGVRGDRDLGRLG